MPRPFVPALLLAAVIALPACGGDDGSPGTSEPGEETTANAALEGPSEDVEVIRGWSQALTESDIDAAAGFFALPSSAENGLNYEIETKDDARVFNDSLPCGATLTETSVEGEFITATFELTERPGVPVCPGSGNEAQTSFVIEDGAIIEWRRVIPSGEKAPTETA